MIDSTEKAIAVLKQTSKSEWEREDAIRFLADNVTDQGTEALVAALEDDEYSIRYASGSALASMGEKALPALLRGLCRPDNDARLREGAKHVLHRTLDTKVREETKDLLKALDGPAADIATMEAASDLMIRLKVS